MEIHSCGGRSVFIHGLNSGLHPHLVAERCKEQKENLTVAEGNPRFHNQPGSRECIGNVLGSTIAATPFLFSHLINTLASSIKDSKKILS